MYKVIASKFVEALHKMNPELDDFDLQAISAYGIELLLSNIVNYFLIILIGALFHRIMAVFVFLVIFNCLRKYIGGYHCNTYLRCNITFCLIFSTVLILSGFLSKIANFSLLIMLLLISGYGIWNWGPVENHFKPISETQKKHCHKIAKTIFVLFSVLAIVCNIWLPYYAWVAVLSILAVSLLLPIGIAAERRRRYET